MTFDEARERVEHHTILSPERLRGLWDAVQTIEQDGVFGDLVECGCFRGGSAAMLGLAATTPRTLWLFDSFQGMPEPSAHDPARSRQFVGTVCGSEPAVLAYIATCGVAVPVQSVKGWYRDTLPCPRVGHVAVLHIDCDWHDSVRACLHAFWPVLSPGAIVQVDDYGHWPGARKAVDGFMAERGITTPLTVLDYTGRQLRLAGGVE